MLMSKGKVKKALRWLSSDSCDGVIGLENLVRDSNCEQNQCTTWEILIEKHPSGKPSLPDFLLTDAPTPANSIMFEDLNAEAFCS